MKSKLQLIFLGAPGSGKGTQASRLVDEFNFNHLSTGDLLRAEVNSCSDLGNKVKSIMESGQLVSDSIVLELLKSRCDLKNNNYLFDGFPRNIDQAKALDDVVLKDAKSKAIYFKLDLGILTQRLINRRTCSKCGSIYNLSFKKPTIEEKCDTCSGDLLQRKDDNEETVKTRLGVFNDTITPILDYYSSKDKLIELNAAEVPDKVYQELSNFLK